MDRLEGMATFVRIVDAGSLSAAARRLRLSLPAVSRQLSALELRLGVELLAHDAPTRAHGDGHGLLSSVSSNLGGHR